MAMAAIATIAMMICQRNFFITFSFPVDDLIKKGALRLCLRAALNLESTILEVIQ
jgi:hypothetical protein